MHTTPAVATKVYRMDIERHLAECDAKEASPEECVHDFESKTHKGNYGVGTRVHTNSAQICTAMRVSSPCFGGCGGPRARALREAGAAVGREELRRLQRGPPDAAVPPRSLRKLITITADTAMPGDVPEEEDLDREAA